MSHLTPGPRDNQPLIHLDENCLYDWRHLPRAAETRKSASDKHSSTIYV
jgi:hypothetical protein